MNYDVLKRDYQTYLDQTGRYNTASNDFNALVAEYNKEIAKWNKDKIDFTWHSGAKGKVTPEYIYNKLAESAARGPHSEGYTNWLVNTMNRMVREYSPSPNKELWSQEKIPFTWRSGNVTESRPGEVYDKLREAALKGGWHADYSNWLQKNMETLQNQYYAKPEQIVGPAPNTPSYSVAQQQALDSRTAPVSMVDTERAGTSAGLISSALKQGKPDQSISGLLSGVRRST